MACCIRGAGVGSGLFEGVWSSSANGNGIFVCTIPDLIPIAKSPPDGAILFACDIEATSHEVAVLRDKCVPFAYGFDFIDLPEGTHIWLNISFPHSELSTARLTASGLPPRQSTSCALSSSRRGIDFWAARGIQALATRGEFLFAFLVPYPPLEVTGDSLLRAMAIERFVEHLQHASRHFNKVIYRFCDFSYDKLEILKHFWLEPKSVEAPSDRGLASLLGPYASVFDFELEMLSRLSLDKIQVLLPFVENCWQAEVARKKVTTALGNASIGCMIETQQLLFEIRQISNCFDFFVIGCNDLARVLKTTTIGTDTVSLVAQMVSDQILPQLNPSKDVYVTSIEVFNALPKYAQIRTKCFYW